MQLTHEQSKHIQRAWLHFETVVSALPPSDTTQRLHVYARRILDNLAKPAPNLGYLRMITQRVNELVNISSLRTEIVDKMSSVNTVLDALL
jgi:hypothetical protein